MKSLAALLLALTLVACGDDTENLVDDDASAGDASDQDAPPIIAAPENCMPTAEPTACSDCEDNDLDGRVDGYDPECVSSNDDDEGSFATGIPGDNKANNGLQDCFFDGNSGMDACSIPNCCITGECPANPDCVVTQDCADLCQGAAVPGCDCFGCCTMCNGDDCRNVITHPALAPDCTYELLLDETACPSCTPNVGCGNTCDPDGCTLCPGQLPSDLPESCGGTNTCGASTACQNNEECGAGGYCSTGCCVSGID